jgi:hypothetical protein
MAETSQFEADQFLKLLTDALRAGPGSPQWHEAVAQLRVTTASEAEEYRLLLEAREHLESGRDYRSISAGPGFTRKVMEAIEEEASRPKMPLPSANVIALLAAGAILAVIVALGVILYRSNDGSGNQPDLSTYFPTTVIASDFSLGMGSEWKQFGLAPVISLRETGLRGGVGKDEKEYAGGGVVVAAPFEAEQSFAFEATVHLARVSGQVDVQLFVAEEPAFDRNVAATSEREFVADLREGQLRVFKADVTQAGEPLKLEGKRERLYVLIKMDRDEVRVEVDGKPLYAGPHGLGGDKQRWPGVRFLTKGSERGAEDVTVQAVRILKP